MSEPTPPKRRPGRPKTNPLDRKAQQAESKRRFRAKAAAHLETFPDNKTYAALKFLAERDGKPLRAIVDAALALFLRENSQLLPPDLQPSTSTEQKSSE